MAATRIGGLCCCCCPTAGWPRTRIPGRTAKGGEHAAVVGGIRHRLGLVGRALLERVVQRGLALVTFLRIGIVDPGQIGQRERRVAAVDGVLGGGGGSWWRYTTNTTDVTDTAGQWQPRQDGTGRNGGGNGYGDRRLGELQGASGCFFIDRTA